MVKIGKKRDDFPKQVENNTEFNKYVASFAVATLLLIIGIFVGNHIAETKISNIKQMESDMQFDIMSMEIQDLLFTQNPCYAIPIQLEEGLKDTSLKISFMEDQLGKADERVINLKKDYSLLQIKHYIIMNTRKEKCGLNYGTILFFYSNKKEKIADSEKQGYVLDSIRRQYQVENVKIYSLDMDLDLYVIDELAGFYDISDIPAMVINNRTFIGFKSRDEVERVLNLSIS